MEENEKKTVSFLEQVELFADTMNERFIENSNGKSIVIFALDANNGTDKVKHFSIGYGDQFDMMYSLANSFRDKRFAKLIRDAVSMEKVIRSLDKNE